MKNFLDKYLLVGVPRMPNDGSGAIFGRNPAGGIGRNSGQQSPYSFAALNASRQRAQQQAQAAAAAKAQQQAAAAAAAAAQQKAAQQAAAQAAAQKAAAEAAAKAAATAHSAAPGVVAGTPKNASQINVADHAAQVALDPMKGMRLDNPATPNINESTMLQQHDTSIDENAAGTNMNPNDPKYGMSQQGNVQAMIAQLVQSGMITPQQAQTYQAALTSGLVQQNQMNAAQGQMSENAMVQNEDIDMQGMATGMNADGSTNWTGLALQEAAQLGLDEVDMRATTKGQMALLQQDFQNPDGSAKIPIWAQGTARGVSKIAAFKGMTGSAATEAMSKALMEASLPIAQSDAQFFQTVTLQNLSNKQQATINRANVLAKMDEINADNRLAAAIQNSKNFLEMDLRNLDNEQQARVINNQNYVQSILEDAKAVNASRLFAAESENDMAKFYDQLNSQISMFNTSEANNMSQFNTNEANGMAKFNTEMNNQREEFYKNMQFNIDQANAKWRQTVTLAEAEMNFEAAATDVKNLLGLSVEALSQIWDRSDSLLDYLWQSTENEMDRKAAMTLESFRNKAAQKAASTAGWGSIFGSIAGSIAGSDKFLDWIF